MSDSTQYKSTSTHSPPKLVRSTLEIPIEPLTEELQRQCECTVLVLNANQSMAREITAALTKAMPLCAIMYAPTIEIAKWILARRPIHLLISSPILADGSVSRLQGSLSKLRNPPDVLVVGNIKSPREPLLNEALYEFSSMRRLGASSTNSRTQHLSKAIQSLGADLRNDLNNPLQEIVALVYVAQSGNRADNNAADYALDAIDKAAMNMAGVVNQLEEKIRSAVEGNV